MSLPSPNFLGKVSKWILQGLPIEGQGMTTPQKYRARVCYEGYQVWLQDKQINPSNLMRRISQREYAILLQDAERGDERAMRYVEALKITPGVERSYDEIANDVATLNHIIKTFTVDTTDIEKAKVVDASDWLIREGMKMGDARAVKSGADIKMQLNHDFDERQDGASRMPNLNPNITGDVGVVKSGQVNYTDEYKAKMARKYGLTIGEVTEMMQGEDGIYYEKEDLEDAPDVFEEAEMEFVPR